MLKLENNDEQEDNIIEDITEHQENAQQHPD